MNATRQTDTTATVEGPATDTTRHRTDTPSTMEGHDMPTPDTTVTDGHATHYLLVDRTDGDVLAWWPMEDGRTMADRAATDTGHDVIHGRWTGRTFITVDGDTVTTWKDGQ